MLETDTIETSLETKYNAVFNSVSDPIFIVDKETLNIIDANPAATKLYQYRYEELISFKITDLAVEVDKNRYIHIPDAESPSPVLYHFKKDGTIFPVKIVVNTFMLNDRPTSITVVRDVSQKIMDDKEKRNLESQVRRAQKLESIGTLAGGIAHDFNNILSSVIGFSELALDRIDANTPEENYLQEIYKSGIRAMELVKQILTFARQTEEDIKPLGIKAIIKEAVKLIRSTIPVTIDIQENIESDSMIMGDPGQVHQIFMNLCTNAAQAMEDAGGTLDISLTDVTIGTAMPGSALHLKPGDYLKLTVSDTGPGIPTDIMDAIFEPYFTTRGPSEGSGMGLAIVHGIVKGYGGSIHVKSEPGIRTSFDIYFPVIHKQQPEHRYSPGEALPTGHEHILLVDDEPTIGKIGTRVLQQLGYTVTAMKSSVEALERFRSHPEGFDLVITDMTMPYMTGDRLASEVMRIRPDMPVVLCTGYSKKISEKVIRKLGVKAVAYKPLLKKELAKTVRQVLDSATPP